MISSSWGIECDRLTLIIMGFFALYPLPLPLPTHPPAIPKTKKNQNSEKMNKNAEDTIIYTCVPKTAIIWGMVLDIQNETDRIFCHFGPFFALLQTIKSKTNHKIKILKNERSIFRSYHFTRVYQKLRSYLWFLRYKARQTVFLSFWVIFCLWPT